MYLHLGNCPTDNSSSIHADLGSLVEWGGVENIRANIDGRKLEIAHAYYQGWQQRNFSSCVRKRGMWPTLQPLLHQ